MATVHDYEVKWDILLFFGRGAIQYKPGQMEQVKEIPMESGEWVVKPEKLKPETFLTIASWVNLHFKIH